MSDEKRVVVKTTVSQDQKDIWVKQADDLGMTQTEFVRTMVQAGRRGFELEPPETQSPAATPGGDGLKDRVLETIRDDVYVTFDAVLDPIIDEIEGEVDDILQSLLENDVVEFSNREGYKLNGNYDGDN